MWGNPRSRVMDFQDTRLLSLGSNWHDSQASCIQGVARIRKGWEMIGEQRFQQRGRVVITKRGVATDWFNLWELMYANSRRRSGKGGGGGRPQFSALIGPEFQLLYRFQESTNSSRVPMSRFHTTDSTKFVLRVETAIASHQLCPLVFWMENILSDEPPFNVPHGALRNPLRAQRLWPEWRQPFRSKTKNHIWRHLRSGKSYTHPNFEFVLVVIPSLPIHTVGTKFMPPFHWAPRSN